MKGENILSNKDLMPLAPKERTWQASNFASIRTGHIHNTPDCTKVGGFIPIGLSPWQILGIIAAASLVLCITLALKWRCLGEIRRSFSRIDQIFFRHLRG